ncbi:GNAT family N-acetyltransferase [Kordia sp.]|uniref:GNAT family N-acetyltransferase n=1 Tax=Kordia sp. TaxID=1965332 RepID=UPI003D2A385E
MHHLKIKKVTIQEATQLQKIGRETFVETYASMNSAANLNAYVEDNFSLEKLKTELASEHSEFYFALLDDIIIGYLKINFRQSPSEINRENTLEIERIYVYNEFHGKKVGQALCEKAIAISTHKKVAYIWLGVWEKNPRAIRFYEKNGFKQFDTYIFELGNEKQTDFLMKREIN